MTPNTAVFRIPPVLRAAVLGGSTVVIDLGDVMTVYPHT